MKKILNRYKNDFANVIHDILLLALFILSILIWYIPLIILIVTLIFTCIALWKNRQFRKQAKGNGIIYGGRGTGKGILLNYAINHDKTKPYCNVDYKKAELLKDISEYLNSIEPITINDFINNSVKPIKKLDKFEKRNVYLDDINIYLPNWSDTELKKKYPSMPPLLAINRHLYDAYCIITTQDRERPYKIIKELQSDFSIKAIKTTGFNFKARCIPIYRYFVRTKYIYHELPKSVDMLPFDGSGLVNETAKNAYLTSGQATKEVYEATNGKIRYGMVTQFKKSLNYDTRYFHSVVYGYTSDKAEKPVK